MSGPVPKRSDQRRRRNASNKVETVQLEDQVVIPDLDIEYTSRGGDIIPAHPIAQDLYDSLRTSGQARFYEPADWQRARILCRMLSDQLWSGRPSAQLYAALQKDMDALLISEAERRRVRLEIERSKPDAGDDPKVAQMAKYRKAAGA